jgi:hypothetical protein
LSFDRALGATDLLFDFRAAFAFVIFLVFNFLTFDFAVFDLAVFDLPAARFDADLDFLRLTAFFMIPPALPGPSVILAHLSPHWQGRRLAQGNNQTLLPITNPQRRIQTLPTKRLPPRAAIRQAGDRFNFDSPRIAQPSVTRVSLRVPGKLAIEPSGRGRMH